MLANIIRVVFSVYYFLLLARVILSWISIGDNFITRFIHDVTEPVLKPLRRIFPPRPSFPLDISPILAFFALSLIQGIILKIIG